MVEMIKNAYIGVMGEEKWVNLNGQEKRDAIMMLAKGMCINLGYDDLAAQIEA
ncbi:MAG: hypothetical protein U0M60_20365 [Clostridia bacterium]|nr:hypothetical protein [Clostridia bacterium]